MTHSTSKGRAPKNVALLSTKKIEQTPAEYLRELGEVFVVFGEQTQDSGNISYGVSVGADRYFVKTAGRIENPDPYLSHAERVELLRNAALLSKTCEHPALPRLLHIIEAPEGPLLVCEWVCGELLGVALTLRDDPRSAFQRFRALPASEVLQALDVIFDLHSNLGRSGWIASDFYDGCLIYDFEKKRLSIVDLDNYRRAPFHNTMGRMFGSTRFMAPEEFEQGALIDERATVFTLGRTAAVLLSDGTLERAPFRGSDALFEIMRRACRVDPDERFGSAAKFHESWRQARSSAGLRPICS